jgi:hypothetical protein
MALFRVDYSGRGELSERQQKVRLSACLEAKPSSCDMSAACTGRQ